MTTKKILITGAGGMLGRTLMQVLAGDYELIPTNRKNGGDITDADTFMKTVQSVRPDVIIHCAAMTAVDLCESEQEKAFLINVKGSENVAKAASEVGARLIHISTDYVFDGTLDRDYREDDVAGGAKTVYGKTKWQGEEAVKANYENHVIARVSWLYGPKGPSFVHAMLKLADGTRPQLKVVDDQFGNPTSTIAVSEHIKEIIENPQVKGVVHLSCEGKTTWYGFAQKIFELAGIQQKIVPCTTDEFPRPAPRPANSAMEKTALWRFGLSPMPSWQDALKQFLANPKNL